MRFFGRGFLWALGLATVAQAGETKGLGPILTLDQCYREAMGRNYTIQRARQDLEVAAGQQIVLQSRTFPNIDLSGNMGRRGERGTDPATWFVIARGNFSQPLFDASILPAWRRGRLGILLAAQELNQTVVRNLHGVRLAYLRAAYSRSLLESYQGQQVLLANNVQRQQERLDAGMVGRRELLQARVQLETFAPSLAEVRRDYLEAVTDLTRLLGRELGANPGQRMEDSLVIPGEELRYVPLRFNVTKETRQAMDHRPDLALLRQTIEATLADKHMAESGYYPRIALVADMEYLPIESLTNHSSVDNQPGDDKISSVVRYGGEFRWRVIDNGQVLGASRRLEDTRQAYQLTLGQIEENVPRDLIRIARALQVSEANLAGLKENVHFAEENVKLVEANLQLNQATQLDFQDAQTNLLTTRTGVLQALYSHQLARAEYDRATGRYLDLAAVNALAVDKTTDRP